MTLLWSCQFLNPHRDKQAKKQHILIRNTSLILTMTNKQGREGGVPPNHMWTPYGFVPFQMGPLGQQVLQTNVLCIILQFMT